MRPPGFTQRGGAVEHRGLLLDALRQRAGPHAPFGVGVAPPGAGAGAGRVDQHQIDAAVEIGEQSSPPTRRADLDVARAGALEPLMDRREAALVVVGGVDLALVLHHRRRAPASCRRRRRRDRPPARRAWRAASSAASCEPSSCTSTSP